MVCRGFIIQAVIEKLHRPSLTVIDRFQKISLIVFHTFNPTGIALKALKKRALSLFQDSRIFIEF
jgi:hypothetical protein